MKYSLQSEKLFWEETSLQNLPALKKSSISSNYSIVIGDYVEKKIRHLCSKISSVEWSGVLFYTVEGSFEEDNLKINCKDICLMDIGSSGYTEFDTNPDIAAYMCEYPELMDCQMGLVHSHNTMSTFFSGTDISTLRKEGAVRNHFVSLIVNNEGTYTAGITRKVNYKREIKETVEYNTFNAAKVECKEKVYKEEDSCIEWFDLEVIKPKEHSFLDLDTRITEIQNQKKTVTTCKTKEVKAVSHDVDKLTNFRDFEGFAKQKSLFDEDSFDLESITYEDSYIEGCLVQLLTGSMALTSKGTLDLNKWVASMERVFDTRFDDESKYKAWAEQFIEFLVFYPPKEYEKYIDSRDGIAVFCSLMCDKLDELKENKYIKILKEQLSLWIM